MHLLEYQAKKLLKQDGLNTPRGRLVDNTYHFEDEVILKAQVPTGNRGLHGGIVKVASDDNFHKEIKRLKNLDIKGHQPETILAEEVLEFDREHYFSLLVDRDTEEIRLLARVNGGIEVEHMDDSVFSEALTADNLSQVASNLRRFYGYNESAEKDFLIFVRKAFGCLVSNDALLLEINPLILAGGRLVALDCKMEIDDNALFRHPELANHETNVNFVMLNRDGNTAVVANGAGLAMATVDQVSQAGLTATNFLDVGGGADTDVITEHFTRLTELPNLEAIIVNIFAGITRCDQVAQAIVAARDRINNLPPLFIRLHGTNYDEAKKILDEASIGLYESLNECIGAARSA